MPLTRRDFLTLSGLGSALAVLPKEAWALQMLEPIKAENPLAAYPSRDWETVYRDIWRYDSKFVFLCAPNDTHNCLLEAYVRNGVIVRIEPTYGYGKATDVYGNRATHRWEPRCCQKGLTLMRRFYGDRRVKAPMVRRGFLRWVEQGFPRGGDGRPPADLFQRGTDEWVKVSWEQALEITAKALVNIVRTYSGEAGQARLREQGYDPAMVEATQGAGTQTVKMRGGMPLLGVTRIYGYYRFANGLALLDAWARKVGPNQALGGRGWDNYSWHTDTPPGHPMVTGQQTVDFDLSAAEQAGLIVVWGMNWIATKMPDGHWLTEARLKGTKVVVVSVEYSATAQRADEVVVIRPGSDPALALGLAQVMIAERLYDEAFVKRFTDLPLLVRLDTLKFLRAAEVIPGWTPAALTSTTVLKPGQSPTPLALQDRQLVPEALRAEWGDFAVWDTRSGGVKPVARDQVGEHFDRLGLDPALEGEFTVTAVDGREVKVAPYFALLRRYLDENCTPEQVADMTWAPREAIVGLARDIGRHRTRTLFAVGMGPNHFFNADLKDRAIFLVAALAASVGQKGGNVGSYAGNYRLALANGAGPQFGGENPFDIELDPARLARPRLYWRAESAHYFNNGDRPLRVGTKLFTGRTHMPTPTKAVFVANSNSILGNCKWAYDVIANTLPRIELWATSEWWWTMTCEYSDIVFPVDAWHELKFPDLTISVTNPFVTVFPRTPHTRLLDTRSDLEVMAGLAAKLAEITGDRRFLDYWKFVHDGRVEVYVDRIIATSNALKGYRLEELERQAADGVPALTMVRTTPRQPGWEQTHESKPWYTKTGRLEFYREEDEFIQLGQNLLVYKEPVEATFYPPSVIVARPHPLLRPLGPADFGITPAEHATSEVRQVLTVVKPWADLKRETSPLVQAGYPFIYHTPKYRHGAHTTPVDTDYLALIFGPFSDVYRRDQRMPFLGEAYADINPADAKALGIEDGDYIWVDGWAGDRPYRGWKAGEPMYRVSRMMCRARYYNATPRGVVRTWFNMYGASHGSVRGHETRPDGLAKNPATHYQAMFRYGSHQSATRAWLSPTLSTDSLVRKELFGQLIGKGFLADVHTVIGAPKESMVRITRAEPGGIGGKGLWHPAAAGFRPTYERDALKRYLRGAYVQVRS